MKRLKITAIALWAGLMPVTLAAGDGRADDGTTMDWAQHERYAAANDTITRPPEVVFMGNSITELWQKTRPEFFESHRFAGRGISGQVTSQMLCRFKADVIDLHPRAVVICGGVNDIVGNNGPIELRYVADNISSMVDLAIANGITPIIATALPADHAYWRPELKGLAELIKSYNKMLTEIAHDKGVATIDYYTPMVNPEGGIRAEYSDDRLHPNAAGYAVMEPIVLQALLF